MPFRVKVVSSAGVRNTVHAIIAPNGSLPEWHLYRCRSYPVTNHGEGALFEETSAVIWDGLFCWYFVNTWKSPVIFAKLQISMIWGWRQVNDKKYSIGMYMMSLENEAFTVIETLSWIYISRAWVAFEVVSQWAESSEFLSQFRHLWISLVTGWKFLRGTSSPLCTYHQAGGGVCSGMSKG